MAHWDDSESGMPEGRAAELARGTLAYYLGDEEKQGQVVNTFAFLAANIQRAVPEASRRAAFGKTLYGVARCRALEGWVMRYSDRIAACANHGDLLSTIWPLFPWAINSSVFDRITPQEPLTELALGWIQGRPLHELHSTLIEAGVKLRYGQTRRKLQVDHVADVCENALAYGGMLLVGALVEIVGLIHPVGEEGLVGKLTELQKRLRYGLPSTAAIALYELGFADRVVAMELSQLPGLSALEGKDAMRGALQSESGVRELLSPYPAYFRSVFDGIAHETPS